MRRIKEVLEPTHLEGVPAFWIIELLDNNVSSKTCITAAEKELIDYIHYLIAMGRLEFRSVDKLWELIEKFAEQKIT